MIKSKKSLKVLLAILALFAISVGALALDPPDSEVNPKNGNIEIAEAKSESNKYNIRHIVDPGSGNPIRVSAVTNHGDDDLAPRLTISSDGDTWVVWWRDGSTNEVWIRKHNYITGIWDTEERVSTSGTNSGSPEILHDGFAPWVAFEADNSGGGSDISVRQILDDPVPILLLRTTYYTGNLDINIHLESRYLWITWVDADCDVGWSEYDFTSESWSTASYESCDNDSVDAARGRVRTSVLGL